MSLNDWAAAVESVMFLGLPWRMLRCQLVTSKIINGMIDYYEWFNELNIQGPNTDVRMHYCVTELVVTEILVSHFGSI